MALIWFDCETTGLDPERGSMLEWAVIVTDDALNELESITGLVRYSEQQIEEMKAAADPVVQRMHEKNGLWDALGGPAWFSSV